MSGTNDFLVFATDNLANVESQADYLADPNRVLGNQPGPAQAPFVNKAARQASVVASQIAQMTCDQTGANVLDNGDTAALLVQLKATFLNGARVRNFSGSGYTVSLIASGTATDVNAITVGFTATGGIFTIAAVAGTAKLLSATGHISATTNSATTQSWIYPEASGQTTLVLSQFPILNYYSSAGAIGTVSGLNVSNSSGTMTCQKTGLTANTEYFFKIVF